MTNLTVQTKSLPGTVVDGMPHLAYYDRNSALSFVWTGHPTDPIHVQHGGHGEPTIVLFDVENAYPSGHETPAEAFEWFRKACDTWNHAWDGDTGLLEERTLQTPCTHHLDGGPLVCDNSRPHTPGHGCSYASDSGSWLDSE